MFKIENNTIHLTRGDSATLTIDIINAQGEPYEAQEGDVFVFTVKKNTHTKEFLFQKQFFNSSIEILPKDTANLAYGQYVYDVQFTNAMGEVDTIVTPSTFSIEAEVTF